VTGLPGTQKAAFVEKAAFYLRISVNEFFEWHLRTTFEI
jgi:hypothetical protein